MKKCSCTSPSAFDYSKEYIRPLWQPQSLPRECRVLCGLLQIVVLNWEDYCSCQGKLRCQFRAQHLLEVCLYPDWSHWKRSESLLLWNSPKVCNGSNQQYCHLPLVNLKAEQKCILPRNFISFCLKYFDFIYYRILNSN